MQNVNKMQNIIITTNVPLLERLSPMVKAHFHPQSTETYNNCYCGLNETW